MHQTPTPTRNLKAIAEIVDAEPFIPPSVAGLCRWVAEYYLCGIGDALAAAFPPGARHVERRAGGKRSRLQAATGCGADRARHVGGCRHSANRRHLWMVPTPGRRAPFD